MTYYVIFYQVGYEIVNRPTHPEHHDHPKALFIEGPFPGIAECKDLLTWTGWIPPQGAQV